MFFPRIKLIVKPRSLADVDMPSDEGLSEEGIQRLTAALLNAGYNLEEIENLGIDD